MNAPLDLHGCCTGKQAFDTRADALSTLRHRERRKGHIRNQGGRLNEYRCPACGKWHLGTDRTAR